MLCLARGDDDLVVVQRVCEDAEETDYFVHVNVVDTAILQAIPPGRKRAVPDCDLRAKDPRDKVPLSLSSGAVFVRKYKEVDKRGNVLRGYQNNRRGARAQKYWKLPLESGEPLEWWPMKAVAGHCRMPRVARTKCTCEEADGGDGGRVCDSCSLEMCHTRTQSDFKLIMDNYHKAMENDNTDQCLCKACKSNAVQ